MGTYNGERFLAKQLDSIMLQTYQNWFLIASDDGSTDQTVSILKQYQNQWGSNKLIIQEGPRAGFCKNFLVMACQKDLHADFYAYCDQDDIWENHKLTQAVAWLQKVKSDIPVLYGARTLLIDANDHEIGLSPLFIKSPSFENALVQSIAGGNTMLFNNAAKKLLQKAGPDIDVVSHDWWTYLVVSACGGTVYYDPMPSLRYRQHEANIIGMNMGFTPKIMRLRMLLGGRFSDWTNRNLSALVQIQHLLPESSLCTLEVFFQIRTQILPLRLIRFFQSGIYRQSLMGSLGLLFAVILRKI